MRKDPTRGLHKFQRRVVRDRDADYPGEIVVLWLGTQLAMVFWRARFIVGCSHFQANIAGHFPHFFAVLFKL
jgi:hypothetical protein